MKGIGLLIIATIFFVAPKLVAAQNFEFAAEHEHLVRSCRGTLLVTPEKIEFTSTDGKHHWTWSLLDLQQIKIESKTALELTTYQTDGLKLGQDQVFKFRLLAGQITPEVSALLQTNSKRPVTTSVVPVPEAAPTFDVPVKHLHTFGGCQGALKIYSDRVIFESSNESTHSRHWRYGDIQLLSQPGRYRLELTTYEVKLAGPTRSFNFELKEALPALAYDYLWERVNPTRLYVDKRPAQMNEK